jgi:hypothetical protein
MTDCHQLAGVEPRLLLAFHNGMPAVTGSEVVTRFIAVTRETIETQAKSSLSLLSPVKSLPLLLRAIGVWGCHLSPVTVVTGDKPSSAPVSQGVAIGLPQLAQLQTNPHRATAPIISRGWRFRAKPGQGELTARVQEFSFLQIDVLRSSICKGSGPGRGFPLAPSKERDRMVPSIRTETKIRKSGIAFQACAPAQRVGSIEQSAKLEFKNQRSIPRQGVWGFLVARKGHLQPHQVAQGYFFPPGEFERFLRKLNGRKAQVTRNLQALLGI